MLRDNLGVTAVVSFQFDDGSREHFGHLHRLSRDSSSGGGVGGDGNDGVACSVASKCPSLQMEGLVNGMSPRENYVLHGKH